MKRAIHNLRIIPHEYKVGDDVSYGFNGDWYPDGQIAKITNNYITTTNGRKYHKKTFVWCDKSTNYEDVLKEEFTVVGSSSWCMCKGHIRTWNPEF